MEKKCTRGLASGFLKHSKSLGSAGPNLAGSGLFFGAGQTWRFFFAPTTVFLVSVLLGTEGDALPKIESGLPNLWNVLQQHMFETWIWEEKSDYYYSWFSARGKVPFPGRIKQTPKPWKIIKIDRYLPCPNEVSIWEVMSWSLLLCLTHIHFSLLKWYWCISFWVLS